MKALSIVGAALILFISSCHQENIISPTETKQTSHFVDKTQALALASILELPAANSKNTSKDALRKSPRAIKNTLEVPSSEDGIASFYIINYEDNGFIILSADNRVSPILAFSADAKFDLDRESYPSGLVGWLESTANQMSYLRKSNQKQSNEVAQTWDPCQMQTFVGEQLVLEEGCDGSSGGGGGGDECEYQFWEYGPLLSSAWGQWNTYNDFAEYLGCNSSNGRAPTGCVATAMGQIMYYHQYPSNFYYRYMNDEIGTPETARMLREIADAVNMNWDCEASSADTETEAASSFVDDFGYSSAVYSSYAVENVMSELKLSRPVILTGGRKSGWWIFNSYKDGHAWVCDGYRKMQWCTGTYTISLHMNWGWDDTSCNGWYSSNNWNPGGKTFNYERGMVYSIQP